MKKVLFIFALTAASLVGCSSEAEEVTESVSTELIEELTQEEEINNDVQELNDELDELMEEL